MSIDLIPCISCGANIPDLLEGKTHKLLHSSPGCYALFRKLVAYDYSKHNRSSVHRMILDTYALQHPPRPTSQATESLILHLISLYLTLEQKCSSEEVTSILNRMSDHTSLFKWPTPPKEFGKITIINLFDELTLKDDYWQHIMLWAKSTFDMWAEHHAMIKNLAALGQRDAEILASALTHQQFLH